MNETTSESTKLHRRCAQDFEKPAVAVITVSDTRTEETDTSGALMKQLFADAGYPVEHYEIVKDDPEPLRALVHRLAASGRFGAVLTNGGTGISPRDGTYEAVHSLLEKEMPGFGELFRMLSWQEVGPAAMLSRATAGLCHGTFVFCMPGSRNAVSVAMEKLIVPELAHLVWEAKRR